MAKKKFIETIIDKPIAELRQLASDKKEKLRSLRFDLSAGKIKNVSDIKTIKKDIARLLTLIKIKENK